MALMKLKEMSFKGQRVFVEVNDDGHPVVEDGRARMRYRPEQTLYASSSLSGNTGCSGENCGRDQPA